VIQNTQRHTRGPVSAPQRSVAGLAEGWN